LFNFISFLLETERKEIFEKVQKEVEKNISLKQEYVLLDFDEIFDLSTID
jgi:hypothetical protein